jgi:hypothetical protein
MHLKRIQVTNIRDLADGWYDFSADERAVRRWVFLPDDKRGAVLVKCVALACTGRAQVEAVYQMCQPQMGKPRPTSELLAELSLHAPQERNVHRPATRVMGWTWTDRDIRHLNPNRGGDGTLVTNKPKRMTHGAGCLFVGYGAGLAVREGVDNFDLHTNHRLARFASLFRFKGLLTNPVAFLEMLRHKARYRKHGRKQAVLERLQQEMGGLFQITPDAWSMGRTQFRRNLLNLASPMRLAFCVVLDITRHVMDASPRLPDLFQQTGVIVLDGISRWCPRKEFPALARLLGRLFPNLQFFIRLPKHEYARFPRDLRAESLPVEVPAPAPPSPAPIVLPARGVLLIDVDGCFPNLALMKLSRHFKRQGRPVVLQRGIGCAGRADMVFASCVFSKPGSAIRLAVLKKRYGKILQAGGTGVDLNLRLPPEIEAESPDFSLYPELGERAIGFLTRGCPKKCPFCIVPRKEGPPQQVTDLDGVLQGRRQLILLDDNLLALPQASALLEEMARRELEINFNQSLDLRLLTPEIAAWLRRIRCQNLTFSRSNYYFSLNDARGLEALRRRYDLMRFSARDNVEFICLYGYDTTLVEDLERFAFLRSLPGAYVFVQEYLPHPDLRPPKRRKFFDEAADKHMDALIKIVFKQNMKSMEKYYRWLCLEYARQCGRIHRRLLETLYRYNRRQSMGGFVSKLETLCRQRRRKEGQTITLPFGGQFSVGN